MVRVAEEKNTNQSNKYSNKAYQSLEKFILNLFKLEKLPPTITKQIDKFASDGYTFYGIEKALEYFYVLKEHPAQENVYSIGIVPYVYDEAKDYYQKIEAAAKADSDKTVDQTVVAIRIKPPDRTIPHRVNIEDL